MKGKFITFEGGEGSGKSTQIRLLCDYLEKHRYPYINSREPGGTAVSEKIREILLDPETRMDKLTETLLFEAARSEYIKTFVKPNLELGKIVISDRFYDSTTAYQGHARGIELRIIDILNEIVANFTTPDLTILLDIPEYMTEMVLKRAIKSSGKRDRLEAEDIEFHKRVNHGYRVIARENPKRIKIIPFTDRGIQETHKQILLHILPLN